MMTIEEMVLKAREDGASDIHLINGLPPKYRKDGQLENMAEEPLTAEDCVAYAKALSLSEEGYQTYLETGELDAAETYAGNRCRIHIFRQQSHPSAAVGTSVGSRKTALRPHPEARYTRPSACSSRTSAAA